MNKHKYTWLWVVLAIIALLSLARWLLPVIFGWRMFDYPHMFTGMMFPFGMFGIALFWIVVIYIVYRLLSQDKTKPSDTEAITMLKQRLSKGEITIEEYEQLKKKIEEDNG